MDKELNSSNFFRVNRRHIVAIDFISDVVSYSNSRLNVKLRNIQHEDILVARERVKEYKEWLG